MADLISNNFQRALQPLLGIIRSMVGRFPDSTVTLVGYSDDKNMTLGDMRYLGRMYDRELALPALMSKELWEALQPILRLGAELKTAPPSAGFSWGRGGGIIVTVADFRKLAEVAEREKPQDVGADNWSRPEVMQASAIRTRPFGKSATVDGLPIMEGDTVHILSQSNVGAERQKMSPAPDADDPGSYEWLTDDGRDPETYCLALIAEEAAEVGQGATKAIRFGADTPGWANNAGMSARQVIESELGDLQAAVQFARMHGIKLDKHAIRQARTKKLAKLLDPKAVDNLGRRLAPPPPGRP